MSNSKESGRGQDKCRVADGRPFPDRETVRRCHPTPNSRDGRQKGYRTPGSARTRCTWKVLSQGSPPRSQRKTDPVLGIIGEGRAPPLMPGCQVVYTVKNEEDLIDAKTGKIIPERYTVQIPPIIHPSLRPRRIPNPRLHDIHAGY